MVFGLTAVIFGSGSGAATVRLITFEVPPPGAGFTAASEIALATAKSALVRLTLT